MGLTAANTKSRLTVGEAKDNLLLQPTVDLEPPLLPHISAAVQIEGCKFVQQLRTWMVGLVRQKIKHVPHLKLM